MYKIIIHSLPSIVARFVIGFVFIESGYGKFKNIDQVIRYFESLSIPFSHFQAPLVAGAELIAGVMILVGLITRLASLPLITIMVVALVTAKADEIVDLSSLLGLSEFLYIVLLLGLLIHGAPRISIDQLINKRCQKNATCKSHHYV